MVMSDGGGQQQRQQLDSKQGGPSVPTVVVNGCEPASSCSTQEQSKASSGKGGAATGSSGVLTAAAVAKLKEDEKKIQLVILEINVQIALLRDFLIHMGTPQDNAELREKIRRVRRQCVECCKQTNSQLLPPIKNALSEGIILDSPQLICLYMLCQLLERELEKCLRLVNALPMDMSSFYETKPTPHGLSSVLSQIVLCKSMKPDFNAEEKELRQIISEMAECLPKEDPEKARHGLSHSDASKRSWLFKRKRKHQRAAAAAAAAAAVNYNGLSPSGPPASSPFCCLSSSSSTTSNSGQNNTGFP